MNRGGSRRRRDRMSICVVESVFVWWLGQINGVTQQVSGNTGFKTNSAFVCLHYVQVVCDDDDRQRWRATASVRSA